MCDFETTVYDGQTYTEVWAAALNLIGSEKVDIFSSIKETFDHIFELAKSQHMIIYFHNLKFDGTFILDYLLRVLKWKQAFIIHNDEIGEEEIEAVHNDKMKNKSFKYLISDMGQWYSMTLKVNNHFIEIRDSLKLLPFSVKQIGKAFDTKHQKTEIEYKGFRFAGCTISEEEKEYIKNDVLIVSEALSKMFKQGHNRLTIASCCMHEYKQEFTKNMFNNLYPNISEISLDPDIYGSSNADEYIRKSYKGGWCYLVKGKENKLFKNGITLDVNSLYPSMLSSESGNKYPIGSPTFWSGDYIPEEVKDKYFFIRIKTRFKIKKGYLPFIQLKNNMLYKPNECLESSDIEYKGKKHDHYYSDGEIKNTRVILTLTHTDFYLFKEHYHLYDFEILDGCYFEQTTGLFDFYITKYKNQKINAKDATEKTLAKLSLNSIYGKFATNINSSFKYAYLKDDDTIGFITVLEHNKKPLYIPVGSACTSYSRNFTIRTAQKNYYGKNKPGFIYADTDSIHCDIPIEKIKGVTLSDKEFCCWKLETNWDKALFVRQKTYVEITGDDYDLKCAGMPERCKQLLIASITGHYNKEEYTPEELDFIKQKHTLKDFKKGLVIPTGKLLPKRVIGGTVLTDTSYEIL